MTFLDTFFLSVRQSSYPMCLMALGNKESESKMLINYRCKKDFKKIVCSKLYFDQFVQLVVVFR